MLFVLFSQRGPLQCNRNVTTAVLNTYKSLISAISVAIFSFLLVTPLLLLLLLLFSLLFYLILSATLSCSFGVWCWFTAF